MTTDALPSRYAGARERIPAWEAFRGPDHGVVHLPHHLAWSGPTSYDVGDMRQRLTLYSILLDCGQSDDLAAYINRSLLTTDWPNMRRLTSRELIAVWEQHLPHLTAA
ncbi:hypothetical protein J2S43_003531 [Catenuloplanes nepalensis]|uniref:Transcriptional regulator n=1 Tax=Catenuloplanes nepalensis TaxID=587533 RepID=A0ABT9MUH4_9ACTN|nr:hypothetical protein [Catenuloplanes nepalensis]MDP9795019.1 hypothetical protein [Catenuloplanes nepalensis]